jgi:plastocyanin
MPAKVRVNKGKADAGCRRMPGAGRAASVRAAAPMVAASLDQLLSQPDPATAEPGAPAPPSTAPPPAARLGVVAREWSLVLSRSTLPAGRALVQLQNFGEDAHNLRIESATTALDVPEAEAGEVKEADGTLPTGDYRVYCTLPGHESAGMRGQLTVTSP